MEQINTAINETIGEDLMKNRFLVFAVGTENYGMEISYITEIVEVLPITAVPGLPHYLKGVINLRGAIVPIMEARTRFGYEHAEYTSRTCIIVLDNDGVSVGLIVDSVQEVADIDEKNISLPPSNGNLKNEYIKGIGKFKDSVQLLLDCDKLLGSF